MNLLPDSYDEDMAREVDYDYDNYECQCCGAFDEDITEDLCVVCFEDQQEAERHQHGPDCKHLMGGLWDCGSDDQH